MYIRCFYNMYIQCFYNMFLFSFTSSMMNYIVYTFTCVSIDKTYKTYCVGNMLLTLITQIINDYKQLNHRKDGFCLT